MSYEKAGKIAAEALEFGKKLIKVDVPLLEVSEKVEAKINKLGGMCAFPVQISLNEVAAHYCPFEGDVTVFKEGDIASLDVGVCVDGKIGDNAVSVDLGGNKELVKASEEALKNAIKVFTPGRTLSEVGKVIEETIQSFGFNPVRNLSGHGLGDYEIHIAPSIPNYQNHDKTQLKEGQVFAVEPFATPGVGYITEGKDSGIYGLVYIKNTRLMSVRKVLKFIAENYDTLPFAARWIDLPDKNLALRTLEREGVLKQYKHLVERSSAKVSQAEHTVKVGDKAKVLTKI